MLTPTMIQAQEHRADLALAAREHRRARALPDRERHSGRSRAAVLASWRASLRRATETFAAGRSHAGDSHVA